MPSFFGNAFAVFPSFLDRTVEAQRPEKPVESTTEIIPGDRGTVGGSWCRFPLLSCESDSVGRYHQLLWPESCPVSSHEIGAERQGAMRNRARAESGLRNVSIRESDAVTPEGYGCYCADQNAIAFSGGPTPPKGPARSHEQGAQGKHEGGE